MDEYSPKKTLSTSTQESFEALDPQHDLELCKYARQMFEKTGNYLNFELSTVLEDYKLLDRMNQATAAKYSEMDRQINGLSATNATIDTKMQDLLPLMKEIDEIEKTVDKLENAGKMMENYTTRLEQQFRISFPIKK